MARAAEWLFGFPTFRGKSPCLCAGFRRFERSNGVWGKGEKSRWVNSCGGCRAVKIQKSKATAKPHSVVPLLEIGETGR